MLSEGMMQRADFLPKEYSGHQGTKSDHASPLPFIQRIFQGTPSPFSCPLNLDVSSFFKLIVQLLMH